MSGPCRDEDALGEHSGGTADGHIAIIGTLSSQKDTLSRSKSKRDIELNHAATIGNGFHGILQVYQELRSNTASKAEVQEREMRKENTLVYEVWVPDEISE